MKLGTKVKCKGYLKRVDTKHVALESERKKYKTTEELREEFKHAVEIGIVDWNEQSTFLAHHEVIFIEEECYQDIKKRVECNFEGVVVAWKRVSTARWYEVVENEHYNSIETGIRVEHCEYIDCYQVFFRMGGSRLVPVDMCEVIE